MTSGYPYVSIIINQTTRPAGTAGTSRDDLVLSQPITLTNDAPGNVGVTSWKWELISWPKNTPTQAAPVLIGANTAICTFTPTTIGTHIIQLTITWTDITGTKNGTTHGRIGAAIKTTHIHKRLPGEQEANEFPGGWQYNLIDFLKTLESSGGGGGSLCSLSDVDCTDIVAGSQLIWDGSIWVSGTANKTFSAFFCFGSGGYDEVYPDMPPTSMTRR